MTPNRFMASLAGISAWWRAPRNCTKHHLAPHSNSCIAIVGSTKPFIAVFSPLANFQKLHNLRLRPFLTPWGSCPSDGQTGDDQIVEGLPTIHSEPTRKLWPALLAVN